MAFTGFPAARKERAWAVTELDGVTPVVGCSWALIPLRQATTLSEAARARYNIFLEPKMEPPLPLIATNFLAHRHASASSR